MRNEVSCDAIDSIDGATTISFYLAGSNIFLHDFCAFMEI